MDLALAFGVPVSVLRRTLTESELGQWVRYARMPGMPWRRIELYLAQLALMVARGPLENAQTMTLKDFMFETEAERPDEELDGEDLVDAAREAFGYAPRKKG